MSFTYNTDTNIYEEEHDCIIAKLSYKLLIHANSPNSTTTTTALSVTHDTITEILDAKVSPLAKWQNWSLIDIDIRHYNVSL